jgi:hypothetical protein
MHPGRLFGLLRRGSAFAVLGVVLAAVTLGLSQCRMVDERLTGVSLARLNPDKCMSICAREYGAAKKAESQLHVENVKACAGDTLCLALEETRHEQAVEQINLDRIECMSDCHHQGQGGGGR